LTSNTSRLLASERLSDSSLPLKKKDRRSLKVVLSKQEFDLQE
jgi:hypothetical protein